WYQFQVEFGASFGSTGLSVIDGAGLAAFLSVVPRSYAIFNQAKIALSLDADFKIVFVPFDCQWIRPRAEKTSRRFDAVEHAAGFFSDVINPFAEIGVGGALTVVFEPDVVSLGGIDQG